MSLASVMRFRVWHAMTGKPARTISSIEFSIRSVLYASRTIVSLSYLAASISRNCFKFSIWIIPRMSGMIVRMVSDDSSSSCCSAAGAGAGAGAGG